MCIHKYKNIQTKYVDYLWEVVRKLFVLVTKIIHIVFDYADSLLLIQLASSDTWM